MKKCLSLLLIGLLLFCCVVLVSCNGNKLQETTRESATDTSHTHTFGDWKIAKDATCTEDGEEEHVCSDCGKKETRKIDAKGHIYVDNVVPPTKKDQGYTEHTCSVCGDSYRDTLTEPIGSAGLEFSLNADGTTCTLVGMGTCIDTEVVIPKHSPDGYTVTAIGERAFSGCGNLTGVIIPDSVTSIGKGTFDACALKSITIPDSVTDIGGGAFFFCRNLTNVYITDLAKWCAIRFEDYAFDPSGDTFNLYLNGQLITELVIPDGVTGIGNYAFSFCNHITSVTIPDGVTSIGNGAFDNCASMVSITIPESVTSIGAGAFEGCSRLAGITIPDGVTSIGDHTFYACVGLTGITIPDSVTSIGEYAFYGCTGLTGITIPDGVTGIGVGAFCGCTNLASVTIGDGVTRIGMKAFYDCMGLVSVTLGKSVERIDSEAFSRCRSLTDITIPDSVTYIGNEVFSGCAGLVGIVIPYGVISIGDGVFSGCTSLTSITFKGTMAQWGAVAKASGWDTDTGPYTIHCTDGDIVK